jgi:hypothetical protein
MERLNELGGVSMKNNQKSGNPLVGSILIAFGIILLSTSLLVESTRQPSTSPAYTPAIPMFLGAIGSIGLGYIILKAHHEHGDLSYLESPEVLDEDILNRLLTMPTTTYSRRILLFVYSIAFIVLSQLSFIQDYDFGTEAMLTIALIGFFLILCDIADIEITGDHIVAIIQTVFFAGTMSFIAVLATIVLSLDTLYPIILQVVTRWLAGGI